MIQFEQATGLRRDGLARICVEDIMERGGHLVASVRSGKGGQALYRQLALGWSPLPPASERILKPEDYQEVVVRLVSQALGHHRLIGRATML